MKQGDKNSLPEGWEMKKLGEVCDFKSGNTINSKLEKSEGEIIYAKVGDMNLEGNEEYITISSRYVDKNEIKENQIIVAGSIIFPKRGGAIATNKKRRILKPTIIDLNTMALVPTKIINQDYLYYWFLQIDLSKLSNGTSIPQINNYSFDEVYISYPLSFEEQQRIVAKLDDAFEAIEKAKANAEQNLKNSKELFESYLQAIFENKGKDWEEKFLNQISENFDSKRIPITKNQRSNGDIPYYGASGIVDFVNDYIFNEDLLCISEDGANLLARTYPIAFSIKDKCWVNNHAHVLKFDNLITQNYVEYYLNSIGLDDFVSGMAQPKLNQKMLNKIPIPLPPLSERQTIVQKLDTLSAETKRLEAIYHKKLEDLEELKKSILQKAFSGQL